MEKWIVLAVDTAHQFKTKDGSQIRGVRWLMQDPNVVCDERTRYRGFEWREQFLSNDRCDALRRKGRLLPQPGDMITLIFNRFGDVDDVIIEK